MSTARSIITNALASAGVLADSQPVGADDAQRVLVRLNDLVDSWATQSLFAETTTELVFQLSGQQSLVISPSGDIQALSPIKIQGGFVRSGGIDFPFEMVDYQTYTSIGYKNQPGPWPVAAYYDGISKITFFPVTSTGELHLSVLSRIGAFSDLDTNYVLQAGASRALSYSLAEEVADDFGRPLSVPFQRRAAQARYALKRQNLSIPVLDVGGRTGRGIGIISPPFPTGIQGGNAFDL